MKNKRSISPITCWILIVALGLCVLSLADNKSGTNKEAEQHFEKANELRKVADYDTAITEYEKVISLSPNTKIAQNAQYWIGQSYFRAGQFNDALSAFQKIIDEYPDSTIIQSTKLAIEHIQQAKKNESLFEAVRKGDIEQVKKLISEGADVNASMRNDDGPWTPLLDAAGYNRTKLVKLLLEKGADVNVSYGPGYTPLYYALWCENEEMVRILIAGGADVNKGSDIEDDDPPLFYAVWQCHAVVKDLIDAGADVNAEGCQYGWIPLRHALQSNYTDVAKQFIGTGVNITALQNAILEGNLAKVRQIIESGGDIDSKDKFGWTPTYWAISTGQKEVAGYLLSKGADVKAKTNDGSTLLHQACKAGLIDIVQQLIADGADVSAATKTGSQLLAVVASYGHVEIVKLLLAKGVDVNATSDAGRHALGNAAEAGHEEIVKLLIDSGAEVNLHSKGRGTALHAAAQNGHSTILDILIANGADVNLNAIRGTPLHRAAYSRLKVEDDTCTEIVAKLLAKGADVNAKDPGQGRTPLHQAAYRGRYKSVELLIAAGADVNAKDNQGYTTLQLAEENGHIEIVELLRKHGAEE